MHTHLSILTLALMNPLTSAYFADWSSFAERDRQPTCVDIPSNMTLCQNIGERDSGGSWSLELKRQVVIAICKFH